MPTDIDAILIGAGAAAALFVAPGSALAISPAIFLLDEDIVVEYVSITLVDALAVFSMFATKSAELLCILSFMSM